MKGLSRRALIMGAAAAATLPAVFDPKAAEAQVFDNPFNLGNLFGGGREKSFTAEVPEAGQIGYIQVLKSARRLDLIGKTGGVLKSYEIRLGFEPEGHKRFQSDGRTPEGSYRIDRRNAQSQFYRSLGVSFPNARDRAFAARHGKSPGGDIFVHGQPNGQKHTSKADWTRGCIAVSNADMDELWAIIPIGCQITIFA